MIAAPSAGRPTGGERPLRTGLLAGSPVPFKVPLYRRLAASPELDLTVVYGSTLGIRAIRPEWAGYGNDVRWDTDLLGGYRSRFLRRANHNKGYGVRFTQLTHPDVVPLLLAEHFDVLWLEGYSSLTQLLAIGTQHLQRLGLVLREEQTLLHPRTLARTVFKEAALRALFKWVDAAVYISRENRRWLEHYGLDSDRLFWSPYAPDTDFFAGEAERLRGQRAPLRAEFGFHEDAGPIIVTASRLVEAKQPEMVVEAFRRVRAELRCGLLIVGSGPQEGQLKAMVERERIPDVHFAGFLNQSQVSRAYAAADIFALLSKSGETFGIAVAESMHFGLALLVSDKVGSAPDLVGEGSNGFVVYRDDVKEAAASLKQLVADPDLRGRFGAASIERILQRGLDAATQGALAAIRCAADTARSGARLAA